MDGGASTPPPGFNPGVSMLEGGTTPIKPISGGGLEGGVGFKNAANVRTFDPNAPPTNVGKATSTVAAVAAVPAVAAPKPAAVAAVPAVAANAAPKPAAPKPTNVKGPFGGYIVEKYELKEDIVTVPEFNSATFQKNQAKQYGTALQTFLLETPTTKKIYKGTELSAPTLERYTDAPKNTTFHKLIPQRITFLEDDSPYIWTFPNIEGNVGRFMNAMKLVPKDASGSIAPHHYVVFTGQFFAAPGNANNLILFQQFLDSKLKVPGVTTSKVFLLLQTNDALYRVSKDITEKAFAPRESTRNQQLFLPYNEPSVVVFLKQHIVLQADALPVGINSDAVRVSELLKDKSLKSGLLEGRDSVYISPKLGAFDFLPDALDETNPYFTLVSKDDAQVYKPVKADIVCPKTSKDKCGGFKEAYKVPELGDKRRLPPPEVYLLYKNTNGLPFRAPPGSVRDLSDVSGVATPVAKPLDVSGSPIKKLIGILKQAAPLAPEVRKRAFVPSLKAKKAFEETIELNLKRYKIRSALPEIMDDWKDTVFTEDEVQFLEDLQFTPELLGSAIVTGDWKEELADFMQAIVESNCFQDTTLLIKSQCSKAERLVQSIYFEMYNRALKEMYDAQAAYKPSAMAEVYTLLKALASMSKDIVIEDITAEQFTGDLLGRRYDMRFDSKSKRFFTNLPELSPETSKSIGELKYKRMLSPDISALLAAFQTKKDEPAVPAAPKAGENAPASVVVPKPDEPPAASVAAVPKAGETAPASVVLPKPDEPPVASVAAVKPGNAPPKSGEAAGPPGSAKGGRYRKTRRHQSKPIHKTRKGKRTSK